MSLRLQVDRDVRVGGWIKTGREAGGGSFAFLEVNDGSCLTNLQVHSILPQHGNSLQLFTSPEALLSTLLCYLPVF